MCKQMQLKPENLFLTGFMGAGKSTIGPLIAKQLGWKFLDLDELLSEAEGMSIAEIVMTKGESYFRACEVRQIVQLSRDFQNVIALGGGTLLNLQNLQNLKKRGVIAYLCAKPKTLFERLKGERLKRPLLQTSSEGDAALMTRITTLLEERRPAYLQAEIRMEVDERTPADIANQLFEILKKSDEKKDEMSSEL